MTHMKLQYLIYLTWIEHYKKHKRPLFNETYFAKKKGPIVPEVQKKYWKYGGYTIMYIDDQFYTIDALSDNEIQTINETLTKYGNDSEQALHDLVCHKGGAWSATYSEKMCLIIPPYVISKYECG